VKTDFYSLKVEPMVSSSYPTHDRFRNDFEPCLVVVTVEGLERVDWETRPEKACWILLLPEVIFMNGSQYHHQVGFRWEHDNGTWSYEDCPIRYLYGAWHGAEGALRLGSFSEDERPVIGRQAASIYTDDLGAHYTVRTKNTSDEVWRDVYFGVCFNHYQVPMTGYRPHFRFGDRWVPFQEIPGVTPACYFPTQARFGEYQRTIVSKPETEAEEPLSFPGVVGWNLTAANGPLLVCHCSKDAVSVGANQMSPCTDLQLWFGDMEPGEEVSRTGHILIAQSDLAAFAERADEILAQL
jgi:hypothetical protein